MSPRSWEPEANLCLSLPPAQLAEMRQWAGQLGCCGRGLSAQGHLLAVTQTWGACSQSWPHSRSLCTDISAYLSIKPFAPSFSLAWL